MALNGLLQDGLMAREGGGQRLREPMRQPRAALNVASIKYSPRRRTSAG